MMLTAIRACYNVAIPLYLAVSQRRFLDTPGIEPCMVRYLVTVMTPSNHTVCWMSMSGEVVPDWSVSQPQRQCLEECEGWASHHYASCPYLYTCLSSPESPCIHTSPQIELPLLDRARGFRRLLESSVDVGVFFVGPV